MAKPAFSLFLRRCNAYDRREEKSEKNGEKQTEYQCLVWKEGRFIILRSSFLFLIIEPASTKSDWFCDCSYDLHMYVELH